MKSFYKNSDNSWIINGEVQNRMGNWKLGYHTDNTYAKVTNDGVIVINNPITEIEKDSFGNKYDSYNEFNSSVLDFFVKVLGGSGEVSWGGVSGNIEDQEDLTNALNSKVDKVADKQLSDENYTLAEKQKLEGLSNYDDSNILSELNNKVDKVAGKQLSDENYTLSEKNKLSNLSTVATSGSYNDLSNKPTIPSNISDLVDDSDFISEELDPTVPNWAKQANKPSYNWNEIDNKPTEFTPTAHNHNISNITGLQSELDAKLDTNKIVVVPELPESPDPDTFYFIEETEEIEE